MSKEVKTALDALTVERGKKVGHYWFAEFTVKDVLERTGKPNVDKERNYIIYMIQKDYAGCQVSPGQSDNGGFIKMKVRSV